MSKLGKYLSDYKGQVVKRAIQVRLYQKETMQFYKSLQPGFQRNKISINFYVLLHKKILCAKHT